LTNDIKRHQKSIVANHYPFSVEIPVRVADYAFKNQAFLNDRLIVRVGIGEYSKTRFNFLYQASNKETGKLIVSRQEEMAFFNDTKGKLSKIPESFLSFCESV